jgi:chromosome segregation ATPase
VESAKAEIPELRIKQLQQQRDELQDTLSDIGEEVATLGHIVGVSTTTGWQADVKAIRERVQAKWHGWEAIEAKLAAVRGVVQKFRAEAINETARTAGGSKLIQFVNELTDLVEPTAARVVEVPAVELRIHKPTEEPQVGKLGSDHPALIRAVDQEASQRAVDMLSRVQLGDVVQLPAPAGDLNHRLHAATFQLHKCRAEREDFRARLTQAEAIRQVMVTQIENRDLSGLENSLNRTLARAIHGELPADSFVNGGTRQIATGKMVIVVGQEELARLRGCEQKLLGVIADAAAELRRARPQTELVRRTWDLLMAPLRAAKWEAGNAQPAVVEKSEAEKLKAENEDLKSKIKDLWERVRLSEQEWNDWQKLAIKRRKSRNLALAVLRKATESTAMTQAVKAIDVLEECANEGIRQEEPIAHLENKLEHQERKLRQQAEELIKLHRESEVRANQLAAARVDLAKYAQTVGQLNGQLEKLKAEHRTAVEFRPALHAINSHIQNAIHRLPSNANGYGSVQNAATAISQLLINGPAGVPKDPNTVERLSSQVAMLTQEKDKALAKARQEVVLRTATEQDLAKVQIERDKTARDLDIALGALRKIRDMRNSTLLTSGKIERELREVLGPDPTVTCEHEAEATELKDRVFEQAEEINRLKETIIRLNGITDAQAAEEDDLASENGDKTARIEALEAENQELREKLTELDRAYDDQKNAIRNYEIVKNQLDEFRRQNVDADALCELRDEVKARGEQMEKMAEQRRKTLDILEARTEELVKERAAVAEPERLVQKQRLEVSTMSAEVRRLIEERDMASKAVKHNMGVAMERGVTITDLNRKLSDCRAELAEKTMAIEQQRKALESQERQLNELADTARGDRERLHECQQALAAANQTLNGKTIDELNTLAQDRGQQLMTAKENNQALIDAMAKQGLELSKACQERDTARKDLAEAQARMGAVRYEVDRVMNMPTVPGEGDWRRIKMVIPGSIVGQDVFADLKGTEKAYLTMNERARMLEGDNFKAEKKHEALRKELADTRQRYLDYQRKNDQARMKILDWIQARQFVAIPELNQLERILREGDGTVPPKPPSKDSPLPPPYSPPLRPRQ